MDFFALKKKKNLIKVYFLKSYSKINELIDNNFYWNKMENVKIKSKIFWYSKNAIKQRNQVKSNI